jgi:3-dehydroquinate synthase
VLQQRGDALTDIVARCCRIKGDVVAQDEREHGLRRILNFGHTVGHALEAATGYRRLRHGEAVGHGMRAALALGAARDVTPQPLLERAYDLIDRLGPLPPVSDLRARDVLEAIGRDKKVVHGRLHFVLIGAQGPSVVDDVTPRELRAALARIGIRSRSREA